LVCRVLIDEVRAQVARILYSIIISDWVGVVVVQWVCALKEADERVPDAPRVGKATGAHAQRATGREIDRARGRVKLREVEGVADVGTTARD
jgi:hypothetical protein